MRTSAFGGGPLSQPAHSLHKQGASMAAWPYHAEESEGGPEAAHFYEHHTDGGKRLVKDCPACSALTPSQQRCIQIAVAVQLWCQLRHEPALPSPPVVEHLPIAPLIIAAQRKDVEAGVERRLAEPKAVGAMEELYRLASSPFLSPKDWAELQQQFLRSLPVDASGAPDSGAAAPLPVDASIIQDVVATLVISPPAPSFSFSLHVKHGGPYVETLDARMSDLLVKLCNHSPRHKHREEAYGIAFQHLATALTTGLGHLASRLPVPAGGDASTAAAPPSVPAGAQPPASLAPLGGYSDTALAATVCSLTTAFRLLVCEYFHHRQQGSPTQRHKDLSALRCLSAPGGLGAWGVLVASPAWTEGLAVIPQAVLDLVALINEVASSFS